MIRLIKVKKRDLLIRQLRAEDANKKLSINDKKCQ